MHPRLGWTLLLALLQMSNFGCSALSPLTLPCSREATACGNPAVSAGTSRIVGGQEAQSGAWPWMVALIELGTLMCGGSIIHERAILTAAHCFSGESNDPSRWQVMAGKHSISRVEPNQQVMKISKIVLHEGFDNVSLANDIALLVLDGDLSYSSFIQPLCVPAVERVARVGEMCIMAGWGKTRGTGDQNVLNQVNLPIIADEVCSLPDWYSTAFIPEYTFCAGYEAGGKDACKGDSGGPLICRDSDQWFIQGVSSWGYQCAEYKWPGVYTNVSKYIDWIGSTLVNDVCGTVVG